MEQSNLKWVERQYFPRYYVHAYKQSKSLSQWPTICTALPNRESV